MERRMEHMGIKVLSIEEEEYCLIPMGGVLPRVPQRVLGIGGTAGMVHPSTGERRGYVICARPALCPLVWYSIWISKLTKIRILKPIVRKLGGSRLAVLERPINISRGGLVFKPWLGT